MSKRYLYVAVLTGQGCASNNRGETSGNTSLLQHVFWNGLDHTAVSGCSIRFSLRLGIQYAEEKSVNRVFNEENLQWKYREDDVYDHERFVDDDLFGYMNAKAARAEAEGVETQEPPRRGAKPKGTCDKRRSPLAVNRAVSLEPYQGELAFGTSAKEKDKTSLFNAECHTTRFQYPLAVNLLDLKKRDRAGKLLDAVLDPPPVGGCHSRYLFSFAPEVIVLGLSNRHSHPFLYPFERAKGGGFSLCRLIARVKAGDVEAAELVIGGLDPEKGEGKELAELKVTVVSGVRKAAETVRKRMGGDQ